MKFIYFSLKHVAFLGALHFVCIFWGNKEFGGILASFFSDRDDHAHFKNQTRFREVPCRWLIEFQASCEEFACKSSTFTSTRFQAFTSNFCIKPHILKMANLVKSGVPSYCTALQTSKQKWVTVFKVLNCDNVERNYTGINNLDVLIWMAFLIWRCGLSTRSFCVYIFPCIPNLCWFLIPYHWN